jgi:[ribosomal protein S18]-alanine N-acetyltransferase
MAKVTADGPELRSWRDDEVRIRRMTLLDLDGVMAIERASFTMPWTTETFRGLLRRADAVMWVAEADQGVVGYAVVWIVLDQAELGDIAVAGGWRRRGIGRRLLEAALDAARGRGVREMFLEVRPSNLEARRLYERYGFAQVGRRKDYYDRPREDALVLRRVIDD